MNARITVSFASVAMAFLLAACGSDGHALPAVPQSAVPSSEPTVGQRDIVTKVDDACLRSGGQTLVFVDGEAELVEVDSHERLQVRFVEEDGAGGLASVPVGGAKAAPIGFAVQPGEWAEEPANSCEGPYFLVVGFERPSS